MRLWPRRKAESRALPAPENQLPLLAQYTGSPINTSNALAIADVWAAVRVLADAASSLPIHVYRKTEQGRERVDSGSLVDLLDRPGPGLTQADLVSTLMSHLTIWGNGYIGKYRSAGELVQLGLLEPDRVRPEIIGGELRFRYTPGTGPQQLLTERDVTFVKGLSVDGLTGLGAVSQAARVLNLSDELVKHALTFFTNDGAGPSGVLRIEPGGSKEELKRWIEALRAEMAGSSNAHKLLVLGGEAEYLPVAHKLDDSQFVEQRRLAAQEIARVFRIPSHMLGAPTTDSLTYSTVEQESLNFVRYSLAPWLRRIELAISNDRDLTFERTFVRFEVDALLRADAKTRAEVYEKALASGWMTVEEIRRLEDLPPLEPAQVIATQQPPSPMEVGSNGRS